MSILLARLTTAQIGGLSFCLSSMPVANVSSMKSMAGITIARLGDDLEKKSVASFRT